MNVPREQRSDRWRSATLEGLKRVDRWSAGALGLVARRSARRPLPDGRVDDLLVTRLWGLGNLALMAPLFAAFAPPRLGRLRLLTLERNRAFVRAHWPHVEVLALPSPYTPAVAPAYLAALASLRRAPPQVVVDAETFLHLPTAGLRAACRAPIVGLASPGQARAHLLDATVAHDPERHAADTFAAIARRAGVEPHGDARLVPTPSGRRRVTEQLDVARRYAVVHPGSGDHFPGRRWPAERFARLARRLLDLGLRVVVTGDGHERGLAARVCLGAVASPDDVVDLSGALDAEALVALLDGAALVVTNDTGPLHLADALGRPTVALFGPNTPARYGPRGPRSSALFAGLPCSPCLDDRAGKTSRCRSAACMSAITVDAVAAAVRRALRPSLTPSLTDAVDR